MCSNVCLDCKCLCMTCQPSQNQICYFHHFCEEKQIGRKPQKCRQSQHHHLKEIWSGGMWVSDKAWENVLEYKYSDPVSPPQPQTTAPTANTLTHTNCYLQECMYAHVALLGFTWGSMWAVDWKGCFQSRQNRVNIAPCWCTDWSITEMLSCGDAEDTATSPDLFLQAVN